MQFSHALAPVLGSVTFAFVVYRRIRRSVGRQRVTRGTYVRVAVFGLLGVVVLALPSSSRLIQLGALAAGAALGLFGLSRTRFDYEASGLVYTPNPYIGLSVVALFVGRLIYRLLHLPGRLQGVAQDGPLNDPSNMSITLTLLLVIVAYYVCYYGGVLMRRRPPEVVAVEAGRDGT